jgi:hypothetical protein
MRWGSYLMGHREKPLSLSCERSRPRFNFRVRVMEFGGLGAAASNPMKFQTQMRHADQEYGTTV